IEPLPIGTNRAGRAQASRWRLRFAPRWRPRADPLTGRTGGGDPLAQVELRFATRGAAERYCRSEGVPFEVRGPAATRRSVTPCLTGEAPSRLCCSPTGPHALCCGDYPIGAHDKERLNSAAPSHSAFSFAG
ncbi:NADH dehydrogenase ubiquinone Fe-S protein 4, partial [Sphingopyxis sp. CCNWLW253]|uniref:NADH dehydrogenase ubiquinone Fe-S protein 4 n=1 Tax=unclassified Sphingopyxis TaxID=2614943 RepID=UPI00301A4347